MAAKKKAKKGKGGAKPAKAAPAAVPASLAPMTGNQRSGGVIRWRFVEDLPCKLDAAEVEAVRQRLTDITIEKVQKEAEKAVLTEAIKGLVKREKLHVEQLNDKEETRPVDCVETFYVETSSVDKIRLDTGEVIGTRVATDEDRQEDMDTVVAQNLIRDAMNSGGDSKVSKLDAGIARAVAAMPPKGANGAPPLDPETARPEDLAPEPGTLGGPGEAKRQPPPPAPPEEHDDDDDDDDDADGPIGDDDDDDPLGLGH